MVSNSSNGVQADGRNRPWKFDGLPKHWTGNRLWTNPDLDQRLRPHAARRFAELGCCQPATPVGALCHAGELNHIIHATAELRPAEVRDRDRRGTRATRGVDVHHVATKILCRIAALLDRSSKALLIVGTIVLSAAEAKRFCFGFADPDDVPGSPTGRWPVGAFVGRRGSPACLR